MAQRKGWDYVIISPVRDEERYVERTLESVLRQTIRPTRWIIVDDGSRDKTGNILRQYSQKYDWITVLSIDRGGDRELGITEIQAFAAGYKLVQETAFDFVVKLDCDLELAPNYFEELMCRFHDDDKLGIASGSYLEYTGNKWVPIPMPDYHTAGASKMVRAECFRQVAEFVLCRGWDTVDEIRAQMAGWKTCHFRELPFHHLKNEGAAAGFLQTSRMHGLIYYLTGGSGPFLMLKVFHRCIFGRPFALAGLMMLIGFLAPCLSGEPRIVTDQEARFYRRMLNHRITERFHRIFNRAT